MFIPNIDEGDVIDWSGVASNKPKKNGAVDMDELIGNTDGFADSGCVFSWMMLFRD